MVNFGTIIKALTLSHKIGKHFLIIIIIIIIIIILENVEV